MSQPFVAKWIVPSMSGQLSSAYGVFAFADGHFSCSCPAWFFQKRKGIPVSQLKECKHIEHVLAGGGEPVDPCLCAIAIAQRKAKVMV